MAYLPDLTETSVSRQLVETFAGYNHNMRIELGEWYNEKNLTSANYPLFARRKPRKLYIDGMQNPQGMLAKDALAYADGEHLYYNGHEIEGVTLSTDEDDCPKQMVSMGAYLCIFPDGVYVNTADITDCGTMGAVYESVEGAMIRYSPCRVDGTDYGDVTMSDTEPSDPDNGMYWLDTSDDAHVLKQYSASTGVWTEIATVYTRIEAAGIGRQFAEYDGVSISGAAINGEDESLTAQIDALNTDMILYGTGDDYIVVTALIDRMATQQSGSIRIERKVPKMDYVCEANNRLWGCYYGMHEGKVLNEIYSCKLGDFKNWNCFMGISTDSYTVSLGSDGEFSGCVAYLGYPMFFKENCIHKIYGTQPSAYQVQTTTCRGVQRGSHGSLAVVNEVLYYKSRTDVCAYDGSLPTGVSTQFGDTAYYDAAAGAYGGKYYISMRDGSGNWNLFAYDTQYGIWHREDSSHAGAFAAWDDSLYMLEMDKKQIWDLQGVTGDTTETDVSFLAESGLIGYELVDHKYVSRFNFRMKLGEGAKCRLKIEYDSSGVWEDQGMICGAGTNSFILPVIPRRCDHFRIQLSGIGEICIYSMAKLLEQGSDA